MTMGNHYVDALRREDAGWTSTPSLSNLPDDTVREWKATIADVSMPKGFCLEHCWFVTDVECPACEDGNGESIREILLDVVKRLERIEHFLVLDDEEDGD